MSEAETVIPLSIGYFKCEDAAHPEYVPECPADVREEPYYIDSECPYCGTELELCDGDGTGRWYDEWKCPTCEKGIHMDWPNIEGTRVFEEDGEFKPLSDVE